MADPSVLLFAAPPPKAALLRDRLISLGFRCDLAHHPEGLGAAAGPDPDLLLVAAFDGASSQAPPPPPTRAGTRLEGLPVILLGPASSSGDLQAATGADEVLPPDISDAALSERLRVWARWGRTARRLLDLEARARESRERDLLTGLPGYHAFMEQLASEVKRHERYGTPVGLVLADIEGMHEMNDRYGHSTGDRLICEVGETLRRGLRQSDWVARYAGDCFAVLLAHSDADATEKAVARLRSLITTRIFRGEHERGAPPPLLKITMQFGRASLPDERISGRGGLLAAAEKDLQRDREARQPPTTASRPS